MPTLYLVATPIGNLEDISRRAERVLGEVARVLAEDTRRSAILLQHLGISVPLVSLHEHNEAGRAQQVCAWLDAGEDLALVSDAGTPLVSDPGARLVDAVVEAGHTVVPVPGPSAVMAALVAAALPTETFVFLGFPPRQGSDRERLLERVAATEETAVIFESPWRLEILLADLAVRCGEDRRAAVGREMTKLHEEVRRGTLGDLARYYQEHPPKGEVTVVVAPGEPTAAAEAVDEAAARILARALLDEGMRPSQAAREVARRLGVPRNAAYAVVQALSEES